MSSERNGCSPSLQPGDRVAARWSGRAVIVERWLGAGANGSVYLVNDADAGRCAMKIGVDAFSLQSEINALRAVGADGGAPEVLLTDDGACRGARFPFYLMTFVPGAPLSMAAPGADAARLARIGAGLLERLQALHTSGWAFGDLKPENVMVAAKDETRLVDYGGATKFGHSVKQYSELYDRGSWRMGARQAEASYDLFAFAVVMLEASGLRGRLKACFRTPAAGRGKQLLALAEESRLSAPLRIELKRLLQGSYADGGSALHAWTAAAAKPVPRPAPAEAEKWPAVWFAGAALTFASVLWWMHGT